MPAATIALAGCAIATYLGMYQANLLDTVWEPFFREGTIRVLRSPLAGMLPVPDAWLGAAAYLVEFVLELAGDDRRWRTRPGLTAANMVLVLGMGIASLGLIAAQGLVLDAWCTLCLASACCSLAIAALGYDEMRAVMRHLLDRAATA